MSDCPYCGEYLCDECEAAILGPEPEWEDDLADEDADYEHDPDCPCEECREAAMETQMLFDLGELP